MAQRLTSGWGLAALGAALLAVVVGGCAGASGGSSTSPAPRVIGVSGAGNPGESVAPSHCPSGLRRCRSAEGRIVFVEAHDPDGDGDAHFVVLDSQGITLPGLTAIKVPRRLRPSPLPGLGDLISAAGQVQTGSHGEDEIHALAVRVARSGGR
jgi:hypothetical protein